MPDSPVSKVVPTPDPHARDAPGARASSQQRWVIDSIEELIASVEVDGGHVVQVSQWLLPAGAKEGDILAVSRQQSGDGERSTIAISIDHEAIQRAREASAAQVSKIARQPNDPGGDIQL